jgi:hypothetical protein
VIVLGVETLAQLPSSDVQLFDEQATVPFPQLAVTLCVVENVPGVGENEGVEALSKPELLLGVAHVPSPLQ